MRKPPHPPDESADELRAALLRNHPEMPPAELAALLTGPPNKKHFRLRSAPNANWRSGARAKGNGLGVHKRGRRKH